MGKLEEIQDIGEDIESLRENGILVDAEADPEDISSEINTGNRYLYMFLLSCCLDKRQNSHLSLAAFFLDSFITIQCNELV